MAVTTVVTNPPSVNGNQVTFHGTITTTCPGGAHGYFTIRDLDRNKFYDSYFSLGFPDQHVAFPGGSYSEGPFTLAPDTNFTVTAWAYDDSDGCTTSQTGGSAIAFRTGEAVAPGLANPNVPADVSVTQQASGNAAVGKVFAITINAANNGTETATDAYVKDFMPGSFQFAGCTTTIGGLLGGWCWWDGTTIVVDDFGDFPSGGTATVTLYVRPTVPGSFVNTVGIGSDTYDPESTNDFVDLPITVG